MRVVKHVALRGCGVSVLEDTQNLTGHGSEQPALADPAWAGGVRLDGLKRSVPSNHSHYVWLCVKEEKWLVCFMIIHRPAYSFQMYISDA